MPRANRHYVPGQIWHITHRCHDKQFLLRAHHERQRWMTWAFEARRRYGLCVLDYCVTCNHVHILVRDKGGRGSEVIAKSMQLIAGRTAQEYNDRKNRRGSFWEDRYHATAVQSGWHLNRCIAYIDLNMVRAGVVADPGDWPCCGHADILRKKSRNRIVDYAELSRLLGLSGMDALQDTVRMLTKEALAGSGLVRQENWTESLAVGNEAYVLGILQQLGDRAGRRAAQVDVTGFILRERSAPYGASEDADICSMQADNTYRWDIFDLV